jgi:hypothetical protein
MIWRAQPRNVLSTHHNRLELEEEIIMLLLITGASGAGKSAARVGTDRLLSDEIDAVELGHLGPIPPIPTAAWRQEMAEVAVRRAITLEAQGRHLLVAGDPIAAGEILAAPSATKIDIAICLLDADSAAQTDRLRKRNEPEEYLVHHVAFADWMRHHATDPTHMPEVITTNGWESMQWDRWTELKNDDPRWAMTIIDTSKLLPEDVAEQVAQWCSDARHGSAPVFRKGWYDRDPA